MAVMKYKVHRALACALGAVLVTAAILKALEIARAVGLAGAPLAYWAVAIACVVEYVIGLALITAGRHHRTQVAAICLFSFLALTSLFSLANQETNCRGCFGAIHVHPAWTLLF